MGGEKISPLAGKPAPQSILVDVARLLAAYVDMRPDVSNPLQRVAFGTSGHRGTSFDGSFNEWHILAITQAICDFRVKESVTGPIYIGYDTHALSKPAFKSALEVLAANGVSVLTSKRGEFTPTPAISHAILCHNRGRESGLADGIVITPSHNPPDNGGFKYNPVNGGPAGTEITAWVQHQANEYLANKLAGVKRVPFAQACAAATTQTHDYLDAYVTDLANVIDFDAIRGAGLKLAVDPLGGAGVHYWAPIAERYGIDLTVVSEVVDPQFAFMTVDWDGRIRMDPSSPYAMQRLLALKGDYDVAFACDTDHDRHGVVTRSTGLLKPNHYLSVMIDFLFRERKHWPGSVAIGKTVVSTAMIDRVAKKADHKLYETPVGFKWFAPGLFDGQLGFGGEESAGASFLRRDGSVWTTDKDGIVPALLSAEITARRGRDPGEVYQTLAAELGNPVTDRIQAAASPKQKQKLAKLFASDITLDSLAGDKVTSVIDKAPGNGAPIGGIKAVSAHGWFAARPSGTEDIYKIYAESFRDEQHLQSILAEAQHVVDKAIA
ncbi:MAG TPA: phosphoglucomutase (alpha-D-glucose-1,6-bisphosphate-dependent) [Rhodanobacteraceae bacterium]|nr:phosphoglucomutase (alpha-D-glucose-1,6-bisphosphate-dependent) [Rhodanobacteraceae bacterium]